MATAEELASVRDRLFGLVCEDQIRQVTLARPDPQVIKAFEEMDDVSSIVSDAMDRLGSAGGYPPARTGRWRRASACGPAITIR
jgi:hypothetical protein